MTKIEKAVREVSDLRDFYRRIPKIKEGTREQATAEAPRVATRTSTDRNGKGGE
jgi:hypothetical protein